MCDLVHDADNIVADAADNDHSREPPAATVPAFTPPHKLPTVFQRCVLPLVPDVYRLLDGKQLRHAPESSTAGCSNGGGLGKSAYAPRSLV